MDSRSGGGLVAVLQSMGGRLVFVFVNAFTGMITARALHPAGRGELAALGVWPNFLGGLLTFGLPSAFIFWSRSEPDQRVNFLWASIPITIVTGIMALITGVIGIPYWLGQYSPHIVHVAQFYMLNVFLVLIIANARAACEAEGKFLASSVALCIAPILTLTGLLVLLFVHRLTPVTAATTYILSGIPACLILLSRLRGFVQGRPTAILRATRQLLGYGLRSYGVDICGALSLYADQAVVVHFLDPGAMGIYVVALSLSRVIGVIYQGVATVLFPKVVSLPAKELIALTGRAVRISTVMTVLCGLGVALVGPGLLSLLYGRDYRGATAILDILILEMIVTGATLVLTRPHMALARPGFVTILQSSGLALSLPLLFILVPRWGVLGASYALLAASTLRLVICLVSFRYILRQDMPELRPRRSDFTPLVVRAGARIVQLRKRILATDTLGL
ncbi:MAG TPA: polysaccharide biosynthesis C-terminal domain-containing protein [Acidobacteriaceae bacterium]|jgi:O-antigen/teichoic acid export membrane protein|nr:polysaccharide biosynthesis C-terminal domain-containing protein [Acidobacteriaceae bacterium]